MIGKCISDINDPNTCKIEALLSRLNRKLQLEQTREFRNTTIIVFFQKPRNYFNLCPTFF